MWVPLILSIEEEIKEREKWNKIKFKSKTSWNGTWEKAQSEQCHEASHCVMASAPLITWVAFVSILISGTSFCTCSLGQGPGSSSPPGGNLHSRSPLIKGLKRKVTNWQQNSIHILLSQGCTVTIITGLKNIILSHSSPWDDSGHCLFTNTWRLWCLYPGSSPEHNGKVTPRLNFVLFSSTHASSTSVYKEVYSVSPGKKKKCFF